MTDNRKKSEAQNIIEDVEHYGKKLKAEEHISIFNQTLKPESNQSNGNLGLLVGSVFFLLILVFLGVKSLQNHEQRTVTPSVPNLNSLPIYP